MIRFTSRSGRERIELTFQVAIVILPQPGLVVTQDYSAPNGADAVDPQQEFGRSPVHRYWI